MSYLKRLLTSVAGFFEALEGMDDPTGHYMFFLEKRIDKLERDVEHLHAQFHPRADGTTQP